MQNDFAVELVFNQKDGYIWLQLHQVENEDLLNSEVKCIIIKYIRLFPRAILLDRSFFFFFQWKESLLYNKTMSYSHSYECGWKICRGGDSEVKWVAGIQWGSILLQYKNNLLAKLTNLQQVTPLSFIWIMKKIVN